MVFLRQSVEDERLEVICLSLFCAAVLIPFGPAPTAVVGCSLVRPRWCERRFFAAGASGRRLFSC